VTDPGASSRIRLPGRFRTLTPRLATRDFSRRERLRERVSRQTPFLGQQRRCQSCASVGPARQSVMLRAMGGRRPTPRLPAASVTRIFPGPWQKPRQGTAMVFSQRWCRLNHGGHEAHCAATSPPGPPDKPPKKGGLTECRWFARYGRAKFAVGEQWASPTLIDGVAPTGVDRASRPMNKDEKQVCLNFQLLARTIRCPLQICSPSARATAG
jgi:hypothetical protein